jgi:hypothetical protein
MEKIMPVLIFCKDVLFLTAAQLLALMGAFFFFGLLLYLLARFTRATFVKSVGQQFDVYITGWIGTPIHEIGHALFCIPFGHKITEMKLFSPDKKDGSLGYVNHAYNPRNIWHLIGNFFIGFGPIFFGSFVLFLLIKYLVPDNQQLLNIIASQKIDLSNLHGFLQQFLSLFEAGIGIFFGLFSAENLHSWQFWVFLYLALSISSHMELSPSDIKGLGMGLLAIVIFLLLVNGVCLFFDINTSQYISKIAGYSQLTAGIFTISTVISLLFFVVSFIVLNIYTFLRHGNLFHPFA